jgi:hypothetical protein
MSAVRGRNAKRAGRRRRVVGAALEEQFPEGWNPMNVTRLKMAGGRGEEQAAERLGKPVSGTVVGGVEPVGKIPAPPGCLVRETGQAVDSLLRER